MHKSLQKLENYFDVFNKCERQERLYLGCISQGRVSLELLYTSCHSKLGMEYGKLTRSWLFNAAMQHLPLLEKLRNLKPSFVHREMQKTFMCQIEQK